MSSVSQGGSPPTTPFFIVGNPRSGTTLMRCLLSGHSRIYIPAETGFLPHLESYADRLLSRRDVQRLTDQIGRMNCEWTGLVEDADQFFGSLTEPSLAAVLDALYRLQIQPHGAVRWGDKGPSYVRVIPQLDRIFPHAQYIHLIRDGRDCTISAIRKWGHDYWYYDSYYLLQTWCRNVRLGRQAGQPLGPQRYVEVRYEALVADPEATMRSICEFLGESFEAGMLDHQSLGRQVSGPSGHHEVERPVNQRTVENWKRNMSVFDQKLSNRVGGELLAELGYDVPDLPSMTVKEWARYAGLAGRFQITDRLRRFLYAVGWLKMSREKAAPAKEASRSVVESR